MGYQIINSFEELEALPQSTQIAMYRIVAMEILITGNAYENPEADNLVAELLEKIEAFVSMFADLKVQLSPEFVYEYKNHVTRTFLSNLEYLGQMSKN